MIRPPRRAVTRFLIPFIDVLILLFCIFLLMPFVSRPEVADPPLAAHAEATAAIEKLRRDLAQANRRLENVARERRSALENLRICVLEIDGSNGKLYADAVAGMGRREIRTAAEARQVLEKERQHAGEHSVGVLLRFPRELTGYPLRHQIDTYRSWFRDIPIAVDVPGRTD